MGIGIGLDVSAGIRTTIARRSSPLSGEGMWKEASLKLILVRVQSRNFIARGGGRGLVIVLAEFGLRSISANNPITDRLLR
jgi:hypothetical protein